MFDLEKVVRSVPGHDEAPDINWALCMPYTQHHDCACVIGRDWDEMRKTCPCPCHARFKELSKLIDAAIIQARIAAVEIGMELIDEKQLCCEEEHDIRWCGTCESMKDGIDLFIQKLEPVTHTPRKG